jgi:calreticulin
MKLKLKNTADWDDDMDGQWEAPKIPNPEYRGEWRARKIPNPDYKGTRLYFLNE